MVKMGYDIEIKKKFKKENQKSVKMTELKRMEQEG